MLYTLNDVMFALQKVSLLLEEDKSAEEILIHCIADVADRHKDREDAWLIARKICIASLQDKGYLKPGSLILTPKGLESEKKHRREKQKEEKYEKYLRYYRRYRRYLAKKKKRRKKR